MDSAALPHAIDLTLDLHALIVDLQERRSASAAALTERVRHLAQRAREQADLWSQRRPPLAKLLERTASRLSSVDLAAGGSSAVTKIAQHYEGLARHLRSDPEVAVALPELRPKNYWRNLFHVSNGLLSATLYTLIHERSTMLWIAVTYTGWMLSLEAARRMSPRLNRWLVDVAFRSIARPSEAWRMNSGTWYGLAITLMLAVGAPRLACVAAVLTLGVGDPAAALVGRRWGRHKLVGRKSLEGTLGFVAVASIAVTAWLLVFEAAAFAPDGSLATALARIVPFALACATAGALAETVSEKLEDNFTIPLATAAAGAWLAP
jgi:dolichol kinase